MKLPSLLKAKYVLFKECPATHEEMYLSGFVGENDIAHTFVVAEAAGFPTAREAYDFGALVAPRLDWWRVGLRS